MGTNSVTDTVDQAGHISYAAIFIFVASLIYRFFLILFWIVWPGRYSGLLLYFKRLALLSLAVLCFITIQLINCVGLLLDEIFFRGYRYTAIKKPVFVIGVPRSGTTTVHRTLAKHPMFTTTSAIDCLLTPSITQRKLLSFLISLDALVGAPISRLISTLQPKILRPVSTNHEFSLTEPEEDFLFLAPILQCFLLVIPFPKSHWLWNFSMGDSDKTLLSTQLTLRWYRMCVRKHLYCNPGASRYLSKNPSFSGIASLLSEAFPDCQIVICERDAPTAVRSQYRVLTPLRKLFSGTTRDETFDQRLLNTLHFYYTNLDCVKSKLPPERVRVLPLWQVSASPMPTFQTLFQWIDQYSDDPVTTTPVNINTLLPPRGERRTTSRNYRAGTIVEEALDDFLPWQVPEEHGI